MRFVALMLTDSTINGLKGPTYRQIINPLDRDGYWEAISADALIERLREEGHTRGFVALADAAEVVRLDE